MSLITSIDNAIIVPAFVKIYQYSRASRICRSLQSVLVMPAIAARYNDRQHTIVQCQTDAIEQVRCNSRQPCGNCSQAGLSCYLRCHPSEERSQGQQGQSHLRAQRDAKAIRFGSCGTRREESTSFSHLCLAFWYLEPRLDRKLHGILLHPNASHDASPVQRAGSTEHRRNGTVRRGLLSHRLALRLHVDPTGHCPKDGPCHGRASQLGDKSKNGVFAYGGGCSHSQRL